MADRLWTLLAPGYDLLMAASGWHRAQADLVRDLREGSVLEVGCGTGRLGRLLAPRGVRYIGVDCNQAMLARAEGLLVRADAGALPFGDRSVDVVVASAVLGLLPVAERDRALAEIVRVTRREVRLAEPLAGPGIWRAVGFRAVAWGRDRPLRIDDLRRAGLTVTEVSGPVLGTYSLLRAVRN